MATLDIHTLVFVANLLALALAVLFHLVARDDRAASPYVAIWSAAFLARAAGLFLIFLRGAVPDLVSFALANTLFVGSFQLVLAGFARFAGRPARWGTHAAVSAATLAMLTLLTPGDYNLFVAALSAVVAAVDAAFLALLVRTARESRASAQWALAGLVGVEVVVFAVRTGWHALGEGRQSLFDPAAMTQVAALDVVLNTMLVGTALLGLIYRRANLRRLALSRDLERALAEVRTLQGLLPVCAWCKRIQDEMGEWHPVEHFVRHGRSGITHGMCPTCALRFSSPPADPVPE